MLTQRKQPDIAAFAQKWCERFKDPAATAPMLKGRELGDDCAAIGFRMDYGLSFSAKYGNAAENADALRKIIERVTDISLLGSAVYSRWRYFNALAISENEILTEENRAWFTLALGQLAILAQKHSATDGNTACTARKICLTTEWGIPGQRIAEKRAGQKLSLDAEGNLFFSAYVFRSLGARKPTEEKAFCIEKAAAGKLLCAFAGCLAVRPEENVTASGFSKWTAELTDAEGKRHCWRGPLSGGSEKEGVALSDMLRSVLFKAFGTGEDTGRTARAVLSLFPVGGSCDGPGAEKLMLARAEKTAVYTRRVGPGRTMTFRAEAAEDIGRLLDCLEDITALKKERIAPPDTESGHRYILTLDFQNGEQRVLQGSYDRAGLPAEWEPFISAVKRCLFFYGAGTLFSPSVYGKTKVGNGKILLCSVAFCEGGKSYCYIADDAGIEVGDTVIVPVGQEGRRTVARVVKTKLCSAEEAPMPLERLKSILGRYTPENADCLWTFADDD